MNIWEVEKELSFFSYKNRIFLSYDRMFFTSKELILFKKLSLKNDYMSPKLLT